jgi:hypothetical protein
MTILKRWTRAHLSDLEALVDYLRHWSKPCDNCGKCLDCIREERNGKT